MKRLVFFLIFACTFTASSQVGKRLEHMTKVQGDTIQAGTLIAPGFSPSMLLGHPFDTTGFSSMSNPIMVLINGTWVAREGVADGSASGRLMFKATDDSIGTMGATFVPTTLVAGGTGNNATVIQTAINTAYAAGGGIVMLPNGVYGLSSTLLLPSNVIFDGNGSTLKLTGVPVTEGVLKNRLYGSRDSNITVRNLTIDVDSIVNTQNPGTNSFAFFKVDHLTIENCNNYDNRNYGFYFLNCSDVKLLNCRSRNVDSPYEFRMGTHNVQIVNCSITLGAYAGLGLYIWENSYDFNVTNFNVTGGGLTTGAIAFRVSDSWNVNVDNMIVDMYGSENVPIDFVTKNIGTPDTTIMNPYASAHNVENVHISNSVFKTKGVAVAAYAMSQSDSLFLKNVRFTNCTFERPDTASVDHRLISISQQSDGLAFVGCKFIFRPVHSTDMFIVLNPDEMVLENCTFQTYDTQPQAVHIVEPYKLRMVGNTFGSNVYFITEARSDSLTRHPLGNYYNTYSENLFNGRTIGNMNLAVECYSSITGNKFLYRDAADTSKGIILGVYSDRNLIANNLFRVPSITDNGTRTTYSNNMWGDSALTMISKLGKVTIDTLIVGRDKGYQWFGPRTKVEIADTARVDTSVNSQRNIAEIAGRMAGDDVGLLVSLSKIFTGSDWQATAMRLSFVVDDAFRTGATSSTWIDFAPYRLRFGVDGTMKYDLRKLGMTLYADSILMPNGHLSLGGWDFASGYYPLAVNGSTMLYGKVYFKSGQLNATEAGNNSGFTLNNGTSTMTVTGALAVTGALTKGSGSFKIDHPLEPYNRFLYHSFVESPDMKNIYDGVVTLDNKGHAIVELPSYFCALNKDYRYQLTAIGKPTRWLYVGAEIRDNRFVIVGAPGQKVSWQVTGIRQDPYANKHRIVPEVEKTEEERGTLLYPEVIE